MPHGSTTTPDPAELFQTQEELRAAHDAQTVGTNDPADHAYNLAQARAMYARLADADELNDLPELDDGTCDQCTRNVHLRFRYGTYELCRGCALNRIRAGQQLAQPVRPEGRLERPADLNAWLDRTAHHIGARALEHVLLDWDVDADTRIGLLERHSDRAREAAAQTAAHDDYRYLNPDSQEAA